MRFILDLTHAELRDWFVQHGLPAYRAGQVRKWLFQKRAAGFEEMTDLPAALREQLAAEFLPFSSTVAEHHKAADGAEKLLLQLHDGQRIECVLLRDDKGHCTACISTQIGCAMGCVFCATGIDGVVRNLTRGEIIEQVLHIQRLLGAEKGTGPICAQHPSGRSGKLDPSPFPPAVGGDPRRRSEQASEDDMWCGRPACTAQPGRPHHNTHIDDRSRLLQAERLSNIVVMGMGEPLLNLDALMPALDEVSARDGLGIGARRITISTVGLPAGIKRLAHGAEKGTGTFCAQHPSGRSGKLDLSPFPPYHLAVSLHAADDKLRNEIVPANRGFGIAAIMAAADEYFELTGRRVTFEYVLLAGVNDQPEHARRLVTLLRGRPALVNLIPYNPVPGLPYRKPSSSTVARFVELLTQGGLNAAIRHRKGDRISAACGQLRRRSGSK